MQLACTSLTHNELMMFHELPVYIKIIFGGIYLSLVIAAIVVTCSCIRDFKK